MTTNQLEEKWIKLNGYAEDFQPSAAESKRIADFGAGYRLAMKEQIHHDNYQSIRAYADKLAEILRWPNDEEVERWLAETRADCGEERPR